MRRRTYPQYKPSGVEWLGEVPEHWGVLECKFGYSIQLGKMLQNEPQTAKDEQVPYLKAFYVNWEKVKVSDLPEMWASPGDINKYSIRDGDLLVCEGGEGGRGGILQNAPAKCIIQNALHRVRPRKNNSNQFLMYLLEIVSHSGWFDILCNKATIAHFTAEKFGWLSIVLPLSYEQRAITAFLDRETLRIDMLMEKKQRQIELLQEKRAALISHAVTKGLHPSAPMKDSEVEWLGQIPAHWKIMRLAMAVKKITNGYVGPTRDIFVDEGVRYLQSLHIKAGAIQFNKPYYVSEEWSKDHQKSILQEGDILIVQTGDIGQCCAVPKEFVGCNCHALIIIQLKNNFGSGFYLSAFLRSNYGRNQLLKEKTGALHPHLECGKVREIKVLLPPVDEQYAIIEFLDQETGKIDFLIAKIQDSIDKLKEYRTALISAAVTGQIDVREATA